MQPATNRTFICSVVFLDIVEYSKKPVAEQIQIKERLNGLLTEALANVAPNDRIILDTGDGAALSFLGDPEDALFVSLALRDGLGAPHLQLPDMKMRVGINLGPVKLVKDINGQPNIIGDGINVAQRVMSFAEPGQILVSRSYYEVVSCLSEGYVQLFHYEGSRTDKHVREHEVYAVEAASGAAMELAAAAPRNQPAVEEQPVVADKLAQTASLVTDNLRRKPLLGTALAVITILAVAVGIRAMRQPPAPAPAAQPKTPPPKVAAVPPAKVAPSPPPAKPSMEEKSGKAHPPKKPVEKIPPVAKAPDAGKAKTEPKARTGPKASAASGTGSILVTVRPWGEVYVDGQHRGDAPPLYEVRLGAGRHRVEIRHPDFAPHVRTVDVANGARVEIRHVFLPKDQPSPFRSLVK
jgi:outer membrane biosynthesis protein TonB